MNFTADTALSTAMRAACAEARTWLGATSPNPPVGAVGLDAKGGIIAVAAHHRAGTPHAEINLMNLCRDQGILDRIATLCVTLEPCNHQGRTPPCTEALIQSPIRRIVIGTRDSNPHVGGHGMERLKQAGFDIMYGVEESACRQLIHAFSYSTQTGKPWVTVKRALTRDGSMIPPVGQKTFTTPDSLRLAHRMRKKCDAIVTGSGTILADDPHFTIRHVADHADKRRWLGILDRRRRVPQSYLDAARTRGFDPVIYDDLATSIADLHQKGAQDILIESGPALSEAVKEAGLHTMEIIAQQTDSGIDKISWNFNPHEPIPFDTAACDLNFMLPV